MKLPTDLKILETIYDRYYSTFEAFDNNTQPTRTAKVYVPIDVDEIGKALQVDGDIVFGRLYYHLNSKYGYSNSDGSKVIFFALEVGAGEHKDKHCIQFPLMASVLSELKVEQNKFKLNTVLSIVSLVVSVAAVIISILV